MPIKRLPILLALLGSNAQAFDRDELRQLLLEQVRAGEARDKVELIEDSLYRLFKLAPQDPEGLAALVRLQIRLNRLEQAEATLARLSLSAPDSEALKLARLHLALSQDPAKAQLQQARLLARAGRPEEALQRYDALFGPGFPSGEHALEYWQTLARTPAGQARALEGLQALVHRYPHSSSFRLALARQRLALDPFSAPAHDDLEHLASDPYARQGISSLWLDQLERLPPSNASAALWQRYLAQYPEADARIRQNLTDLQRLLANPAFQARQRALQLLDQESTDHSRIERGLRAALAGFPDQPELLGALGRLRQRQGRQAQALALYRQALAHEDNIDQLEMWRSLIDAARFWTGLQQASEALSVGDLAQAEQSFRAAAALRPRAAEPLIGLAELHLRRDQATEAERFYQAVLAFDGQNVLAKRGLIDLYATTEPQHARALLHSLPEDQRRQLEPELDRRQAAHLVQQARRHAEQQRWATARLHLGEAQALQPADPWIAYHLAKARAQLGDPEAEQSFTGVLRHAPFGRSARYAHGLFLASQERSQQALDSLIKVPITEWDDDLRALDRRLRLGLVLAQARRLNDQGRQPAARAYLRQQQRLFPDDASIPLTLAEWAALGGDRTEAELQFHRALRLEPDNFDAELGLLELDPPRLGNTDRARLEALSSVDSSPSQQRRLANLWLQLGEPARAERLMAQARLTAPNDPWIWRDSARLAKARGLPQQALAHYREALRGSDALDELPSFSQSTRMQDGDDWLSRSIRSDAAALYLDQASTATLQLNRLESSGTPGLSDLQADRLQLELAQALGNGRGFARIEQVSLDTGRLRDLDAAADFGSLRLCQACALDGRRQQDQGTSLALGWQDEWLQWDLGTTPLGFAVSDLVGGLQWRGDVAALGWNLNLSRRALNNSLLSFAGSHDPRSGETWGGVRATGVRLGLSYDQGGFYGLWSSLQAHRLSGRNVPDNDRYRLMAGLYLRLLDQSGQRLRIGLNTLHMHYDQDLSGYTFGQGGYYSPQRYHSLSLPLNYARRWGDWSWFAEAAVGFAWTRHEASPLFPTRNQWQREAGNPFSSGGDNAGFSYRASFSLERRLTPNWFIGSRLATEHAMGSDYQPHSAQLYLRYSFAPWEGDLGMPVQPLEDYAEFN